MNTAFRAKAQFATVANAGHLPWNEQPEATFTALDRFIEKAGPGSIP